MTAAPDGSDTQRPSPEPRRRRRPWLLLAVVALAAAAVWWTVERRSSPEPGAPMQSVPGARKSPGARGPGGMRIMPVTVAAAERADVPVVLDALGTVTSLRTVTVRSRVDGQLRAVHFREGQLVQAGELLAEIDPRPFEVQLMQAQGQLARDRALLENAKVDLERYRTLVAQDAASAQQLDTQRALVQQYEGILKTDQAQVEDARLQLAYSRITAPLSGRLGLRLVDPGNLVRAGDATGLVTITQVQPIGVLFSVPEKELPAVLRRYRAGSTMTAQALDRDQREVLATGRLTTIDNQIDVATGTLKMRAEFANTDSALFPNQFVNVRVQIDTLAGATVVPSAAIQRGAPGTYVYVVRSDDTVALRKVSLGPVDGQRTVVSDGVAVGDRVVIDGVDNLRDGAPVEPIDKEAAERAADQAPAPRKRADAGSPRSR